MFKLKYKPPKPEEGFTLIEVLVTALVLVGFLLGALQAITLATLLRVQAQAKSEAVNWINNDKTKIEYQASIVGETFTPTNTDPDCTLSNFRATLIANNYRGDTDPTALSETDSSNAHVIWDATTNLGANPSEDSSLSFLNKTTYRVARFYRYSPDPTDASTATTLQITWHLWDEGNTVVDNDTGGNPDLGGTGGDADDRSISVITTEVVPNISSCN